MSTIFRFIPAAEKIDAANLADLFAEPPGYDKFAQPVNHLLIGAKGSGKSALLRAVSLPVVTEKKPLASLPFVDASLKTV